MAGATERLRLVTSVLVLPYRNPVLTAKMVASLDVLSGGRVTLGVGVGWLKEEFEALDSPDFEQPRRRHRRMDRDLQAALDAARPPASRGEFYNYQGHPRRALPAAEAASADLGRRPFAGRAAPHGQAWRRLASGRRDRGVPACRRRRCVAHLQTLKQLTEAEGRDFSALTISYKAPLYDTGIPDRDGTRRSFSGTADEIAGDIRAFAAIGVHELIFDFRGESHRPEHRAPAALRRRR